MPNNRYIILCVVEDIFIGNMTSHFFNVFLTCITLYVQHAVKMIVFL